MNAVLLFWVLPALIGAILISSLSRSVDNHPMEDWDGSEYFLWVCISIVYPIAVIGLLIFYLPKLDEFRFIKYALVDLFNFLTKEITFKSRSDAK